jgi:hypothetical protein
MAIVIKVKADTKELERDIERAAQKAKSAFSGVSAGGTTSGTTGIGAIQSEIDRTRARIEALKGSAEALKDTNTGLGGGFTALTTGLRVFTTGMGAATLGIGLVAVAAAKGAEKLSEMAAEGSKLANQMLETAKATNVTTDQVQKLEKGGKDLTDQLRRLGAVIDKETLEKSAAATHQFSILEKQIDAMKIKMGAEFRESFSLAGIAIQTMVQKSEPWLLRLSELVNGVGLGFETWALWKLGLLDDAMIRQAQTRPGAAATGSVSIGSVLAGASSVAPAGRPGGRLRGLGGGGGVSLPSLPTGSIDAIRTLGRVLEELEDNAIAAARAIAGMNARTLEIFAGRARIRSQLEDIPTITAEQAGLTTGIDDSGIRRKISEFDDFVASEAAKAFEEVRQQAVRFKEGIAFTFEAAFREGFERGPKAFLQATAAAIKSFFSQIAAELSTGVIELILFGKGGASGQGIGRGGLLGGLSATAATGSGGLFGGLLGNFGGLGGGTFGGSIFGGGGGGGSIGVAPSLSGNLPILSSSGILNASGFGGLIPGGVGGGAAAGGIFGGVGGLAGIAGPALLGGLLGTSLGGKSLGGKILGGIGGGIAGIGVGIGAAVGLAGGGLLAGALAATGFGLLALPFIVGAVLLGKAKQRRTDEAAADAIWVSERDQIRQLIQAVNADRIDGVSALAEAQALRGATVQQLSQIKTKSVRESRLSNQLRDLDNTVIAELRAAVERQARRQGVRGGLVPEFQSGGYVQGVDMGRDSVLARVRPGELVLTKQHQRSIQSRAGQDIFEEIGLPGYQRGGYVQPPASTAGPVIVELHIDEGVMLGRIQSNDGQQVIVKTIRKARLNGEL